MATKLISIPDLPDVLPQGIGFYTFAEEITLDSAAASHALVTNLPAGAIVVSAYLRVLQTVTAATAVKIGLGRSTSTADPDKYALSADLNAGTVGGLKDFWNAPLSAAENLAIYACATDGSAAGTIGTNTAVQLVRAQITYAVPKALI